MSKHYPLDIQNVGEDIYTLMSKGHHDPHEFMRQVREDGWDWPLGMPEHKWVRTVPTRNPGYYCMYVFVDGPGPGAFPATYVSEAYHDDTYESIVASQQSEGGKQS